MTKATVLTGPPTVACIAEMQLNPSEILSMVDWVESRRPECIPDTACYPGYPGSTPRTRMLALFPHDGDATNNELLVELAGRKCYDSFGEKAGRKTNAEYIANTQASDIPHASIMYHAKMTFFIGGISRRVSHELIRHYVGADRDEEGSPSQESTRYVEHAGRYIAHPYILEEPSELNKFTAACQHNYQQYLAYILRRVKRHRSQHDDQEPKGIYRKRIFESASPLLMHSCETSFIWTTNPIALAKLLKERDNDAADLEFQRLAKVWKKLVVKRFPNLFPQPWMQSDA